MALQTLIAARSGPCDYEGALLGTEYACTAVGWNGGEVTSVPEVPDAYLRTENGRPLYVVRPKVWTERKIYVQASALQVLVGNCEGSGILRSATIADLLRAPAGHGCQYAGMGSDATFARGSDERVHVRFQTVFLPTRADDGQGSVQFCAHVYPRSNDLALLSSAAGTSLHMAAGDLLVHSKKEGKVSAFWMRTDLVDRGEKIGNSITLNGIATRSNAILITQVPLLPLTPSHHHLQRVGQHDDAVPVEIPRRDWSRYVTITVALYYTVPGGVPTIKDVKEAFEELRHLYAAGEGAQPLSEQRRLMRPERVENKLREVPASSSSGVGEFRHQNVPTLHVSSRELTMEKLLQLEKSFFPQPSQILELKLLLAGAIDDRGKRKRVTDTCQLALDAAKAKNLATMRSKLTELSLILDEAFA